MIDSQGLHREVIANITEVMVSLIPALADIFPQETSDEWPVDNEDIIDELIRNVKSGIRCLYDVLLPLVDLFQRHYSQSLRKVRSPYRLSDLDGENTRSLVKIDEICGETQWEQYLKLKDRSRCGLIES